MSIAFAMLIFVAATGKIALGGQWGNEEIHVNIPFSFTVGDTTLPAGEYIIRTPQDVDPHVLQLQSADGHTAVVFISNIAHSETPPSKTEVIFKNFGDKNFLSEVWVQGNSEGAKLADSRAEQRLEEKQGKPKMISVPANSQKERPPKK
jgi:hypothetical protein